MAEVASVVITVTFVDNKPGKSKTIRNRQLGLLDLPSLRLRGGSGEWRKAPLWSRRIVKASSRRPHSEALIWREDGRKPDDVAVHRGSVWCLRHRRRTGEQADELGI